MADGAAISWELSGGVNPNGVPTLGLSMWLGLLTARQLGPQNEYSMGEHSKKECPKRLDRSSKISQALALKVPGCHFWHILLLKQITKASPDSR